MLSMAIRKRAPAWARHVVRLTREIVPSWAPPPALPGELFSDCRVCASRDRLLRELPKGGRVVEVGTDTGAFAARILGVCEPIELHLIDLDFSKLCQAVADDRRVTRHAGRSHERLADLANDGIDWIYIDADHSYPAVLRDAKMAVAKVRPGGFLVFNDFAHIDPFLGRYGVHRAVVEFAAVHRWPFIWLAYEPHGLYDVALRRPS